MPRHRSQINPGNNQNQGQNMSDNPYPDLMAGNSSPPTHGPQIRNIGESKFYQESSNNLLRDPQAPFNPRDVFQGDIDNVYRSNINLGDLKLDSFPMTGSRLVPDDMNKDNKRERK